MDSQTRNTETEERAQSSDDHERVIGIIGNNDGRRPNHSGDSRRQRLALKMDGDTVDGWTVVTRQSDICSVKLSSVKGAEMLPQIGDGQRCCLYVIIIRNWRLYASLLNENFVFGFQLHDVAAQRDIVGSQPLNLADQIIDHQILQRDLLLEQLRVLCI